MPNHHALNFDGVLWQHFANQSNWFYIENPLVCGFRILYFGKSTAFYTTTVFNNLQSFILLSKNNSVLNIFLI
jgi:hypothetical protein